jgi:hypothetical protein
MRMCRLGVSSAIKKELRDRGYYRGAARSHNPFTSFTVLLAERLIR